jgi:hypothetical protein
MLTLLGGPFAIENEGRLMHYVVHGESFAGRPLAIVKRKATKAQLGAVIQEACGTVWNALRSHGIRGGRHVAVYLDSDFKLEVGAEVDTPFNAIGEVISSSLPIGEVATTTHFGPYQLLGNAHQAIQDWCAANHREPVRPCWETYGHWLDEWNSDPTKIRTDVYYLLKR